ncbi:MAG: hypothetical protein QOI27_1625 [Gaiellaceae bacterium]|nr:hypothetical protein [Gaiellaceae bacterium]MDX6472353.1 hypothetical protein [Gaiellaceae bacterium]
MGLTSVRRIAPLVLLLGLAAGVLPAASAVQPTGFAFGRLGGNIRPYTVSIANSGTVRTSGAVEVGRMMLTSVQLATLNRVATETNFVKLPAATNCAGTLPDVASTFVRVGARTVRVHGGCVPRYQRLLKALQASVRIA